MPLVLSMKPGDDFFVGSERVVVEEVRGECEFTLRTADGRAHEISDKRGTEVLPGVMVSAGNRAHAGLARVAIDAPQEVPIMRGQRYREERGLPGQ